MGGKDYERKASDVTTCDQCEALCRHHEGCSAVTCKPSEDMASADCYFYTEDNYHASHSDVMISWSKKCPESKGQILIPLFPYHCLYPYFDYKTEYVDRGTEVH